MTANSFAEKTLFAEKVRRQYEAARQRRPGIAPIDDLDQRTEYLGRAITFLYGPAFHAGRVFSGPTEFSQFAVELGDILIRIYALDPQNYAVNEAHVKEEFEKLSLAGLTAAERLADMTRAMQRLTQTVADLEAQMAMNPMATKPESVFLIQEEPDIEELLA